MEILSEQTGEIVFSVHEFIEYTNLLVARKSVVVQGEIGSFNISQNKWVFFDLKEDDARVSCMGMVYKLPRDLADGVTVRIIGTPRVHQKSGRFSIFVDHVELVGEGALKKAFEETKKKLQSEGLFDQSRKRPLPTVPERIGIIASRESAAYTDFMRILNTRWGGIDIELVHVKVQGEGAVEDIVQAFSYFNTQDTGCELIVLTRGGGSMEDLHAFNSEEVARAVFGSRLPVVCGVGHERDESLADYVADVRAATPTHAATLVVPDRDELSRQLRHSVSRMNQYVEGIIEWNRHAIDRYMASLEHTATRTLHDFSQLEKRFVFALASTAQQVEYMSTGIETKTQRLLFSADSLYRELARRLSQKQQSLLHLGPGEVLKRGYSIIKRKGSAITSASALKPGDSVEIAFHDGDRHATIQGNQQSLL